MRRARSPLSSPKGRNGAKSPDTRSSPSRWVDAPFAHVQGIAGAHASQCSANPYDAEKRAFVEKVKATVGERAIILNAPFDGSIYAYSTDDLNAHQRYMSGYGWNEGFESVLVRTSLHLISKSDLVNDAVKSIGADYVMVLDRNAEHMDRWFWSYADKDWCGFAAVTDETPGFEVVLAEGDMRLYRIITR